MAIPKKEDRRFKWSNFQTLLARSLTFTRAKSVAVGASGTTLQSSIAEAIADLDSSQNSPLQTLGEVSSTLIDTEAQLGSGANKGQLQRVEDLITLFFGDGETPGILEQLKDMETPSNGAR